MLGKETDLAANGGGNVAQMAILAHILTQLSTISLLLLLLLLGSNTITATLWAHVMSIINTVPATAIGLTLIEVEFGTILLLEEGWGG